MVGGAGKPVVCVLDYGAGNVRSVCNAVRSLGHEVQLIDNALDIDAAQVLIFPGVGSFGSAMRNINSKGFAEPLKKYIASDRPFFGICLGMQTLYESSAESPGVKGLGVIPGAIGRFDGRMRRSVPHMGWNIVQPAKVTALTPDEDPKRFYFTHSFYANMDSTPEEWVLSTTNYHEKYVCALQRGNIIATQFHPEKSGRAGLDILQRFLALAHTGPLEPMVRVPASLRAPPSSVLAKRVIACLDVRSNEHGDLVVTKGDQYDVKEEGRVRDLGQPVDLAYRYYQEGADEVTFLNITSFRNSPLKDLPMLEVLKRASERVFVPLCIGGGIRNLTDDDGKEHSAVDVAAEYFRSGADKVSIGSDAVEAALRFMKTGVKDGTSSVEMISERYGSQAVVISVDPKRVYVTSPDVVKHNTIKTEFPGPNGEEFCWYQCTVRGGREVRDIGARELATACEALGAGEILLNCIDKDGTNSGFDHELINQVKSCVSIPVIASSGAGRSSHFTDLFANTSADAGLAAGIFHRNEVSIEAVKAAMAEAKVAVRR